MKTRYAADQTKNFDVVVTNAEGLPLAAFLCVCDACEFAMAVTCIYRDLNIYVYDVYGVVHKSKSIGFEDVMEARAEATAVRWSTIA